MLDDQPGLEAWEEKLLKDFQSDRDACAEVYLDRGLRAYGKKNFNEALTFFQKVCMEYPDASSYGDAQYDIGLILHDQQKFGQAIAEYAKVARPNSLQVHAASLRRLIFGATGLQHSNRFENAGFGDAAKIVVNRWFPPYLGHVEPDGPRQHIRVVKPRANAVGCDTALIIAVSRLVKCVHRK